MRPLFSIILTLFITHPGLAQKREISSYSTSSNAILSASYGWTSDTLGKIGARLKAFDEIRYSKVDSFSKKFLFGHPGKPNHISKFYSGNTNKDYVGFIYYVFCENDYPKERSFSGSYIEFCFDEKETKLQYIYDGLYCF